MVSIIPRALWNSVTAVEAKYEDADSCMPLGLTRVILHEQETIAFGHAELDDRYSRVPLALRLLRSPEHTMQILGSTRGVPPRFESYIDRRRIERVPDQATK
jgi:hypothetical protein